MNIFPTRLTNFFSPPTVYPPSEIAKIGDAARGSLLVEKLEQIPSLLQSLVKEVHGQGGQIWMKNNYWKDKKILSKGYVGIHMRISLPVPEKPGACILTEVQIHPKGIMDGTKKCAKELAHRFYKIPSVGAEEDREIVSCSQLIYLTSMVKLLYPEQELKTAKEAVDQYVELDKIMSVEERNIERLILETAFLLKKDKDTLGTGKFIKKYQAVLPKNCQAIADAWMETAQRINSKLERLGVTSQFSGLANLSIAENTAKSFEELREDATLVAPIFNKICVLSANQPGCSVTYGTDEAHMLKSEKSLREKLDEPIRVALKKKPKVVQYLAKLQDPQVAKNAKKGISLIGVIAGFCSAYSWYTASNSRNAMQGGFNSVNSEFHTGMDKLKLLPDVQRNLEARLNFLDLSIDSTESTTASINRLSGEVIACNLELFEQIKAKNDSIKKTALALQKVTTARQKTTEAQQRHQDEISPVKKCFEDMNTALYNGYGDLPDEEQKRFKAKMLLANISLENTNKSCAAIIKGMNEVHECRREQLICLTNYTEALRLKDLANSKTIDVLNQTLTLQINHTSVIVPLSYRNGVCSTLENITKQKDDLLDTNRDLLLQIADKKGNLTACEKDRTHNNTLLEKCEKARDDFKKEKEDCITAKNTCELEKAGKRLCFLG
jgi:hypothetical protein